MRDQDEGVEDSLAQSIEDEHRQQAGAGEEEESEEQESGSEEEQEEGSEESESEEEEQEEESAGPEDEEEEEEEGQEERGRPRGRAGDRIRRQSEELRTLRAENERLRGQSGNQEVRRQPAQDPQAIRKAIRDDIQKTLGDQGLALMTPAQQADVLTGAVERIMSPVMRQFAGSVGADRDRTGFREKYGSTPLFKKFSTQVEAKFADAQAQGYFIPREQFFKELVAEATLKGLDKGGAKQRRERDIRKQKAGGQSTTGRGDVGTGGRKMTKLQRLERDLGDKQI